MKNSTLFVFSVIRNIDDFVKKGRNLDLFQKSHLVRFKRSSKFYTENAKRIYNDIENGYYTIKDLAIFLLYRYLVGEKRINLYKIKPKHITDTMKLFTAKRLKEDLKLLKAIHKELEFKSIQNYFDIKEDGTNIAYILTIQGKISPVFFTRNIEKFLTKRKENVIINTEFEQFVRIAKKIEDTFKRRFF